MDSRLHGNDNFEIFKTYDAATSRRIRIRSLIPSLTKTQRALPPKRRKAAGIG